MMTEDAYLRMMEEKNSKIRDGIKRRFGKDPKDLSEGERGRWSGEQQAARDKDLREFNKGFEEGQYWGRNRGLGGRWK